MYLVAIGIITFVARSLVLHSLSKHIKKKFYSTSISTIKFSAFGFWTLGMAIDIYLREHFDFSPVTYE